MFGLNKTWKRKIALETAEMNDLIQRRFCDSGYPQLSKENKKRAEQIFKYSKKIPFKTITGPKGKDFYQLKVKCECHKCPREKHFVNIAGFIEDDGFFCYGKSLKEFDNETMCENHYKNIAAFYNYEK